MVPVTNYISVAWEQEPWAERAAGWLYAAGGLSAKCSSGRGPVGSIRSSVFLGISTWKATFARFFWCLFTAILAIDEMYKQPRDPVRMQQPARI